MLYKSSDHPKKRVFSVKNVFSARWPSDSFWCTKNESGSGECFTITCYSQRKTGITAFLFYPFFSKQKQIYHFFTWARILYIYHK